MVEVGDQEIVQYKPIKFDGCNFSHILPFKHLKYIK